MPREAAAVEDTVAFIVPNAPMPPPSELTEQEVRYWRALVDAFPGDRFGADDHVLLVELVRAQARARQINEQLELMRTRALTMTTVPGNKIRRVFIQLAQEAREESRLIAMLCVKLRLATQTRQRKIVADRERERMATGPRPWETIAGQH
jgi:hypothetical protein